MVIPCAGSENGNRICGDCKARVIPCMGSDKKFGAIYSKGEAAYPPCGERQGAEGGGDYVPAGYPLCRERQWVPGGAVLINIRSSPAWGATAGIRTDTPAGDIPSAGSGNGRSHRFPPPSLGYPHRGERKHPCVPPFGRLTFQVHPLCGERKLVKFKHAINGPGSSPAWGAESRHG